MHVVRYESWTPTAVRLTPTNNSIVSDRNSGYKCPYMCTIAIRAKDMGIIYSYAPGRIRVVVGNTVRDEVSCGKREIVNPVIVACACSIHAGIPVVWKIHAHMHAERRALPAGHLSKNQGAVLAP